MTGSCDHGDDDHAELLLNGEDDDDNDDDDNDDGDNDDGDDDDGLLQNPTLFAKPNF